MAVRARLSPPRAPRTEWPWHSVQSASLRSSLLFRGGRRLEAEAYLGEGYATRLAIESQSSGWTPLSKVARTWQPSRLKGIPISREHGTAFLTATQVYDVRPMPRKWLPIDRTHDHAKRFVSSGQILLTRSGNVGRATLAHNTTKGIIVSDDLLRVDAANQDWWGWIYAYLRALSVRKMMKAVEYGHIIKHLETHHLDSLPIVWVSHQSRAEYGLRARNILQMRNKAHELTVEAEARFAGAFGQLPDGQFDTTQFTTRANRLFAERRRLDAAYYSPAVKRIVDHLSRGASGWSSLTDLGFEVWLPDRFQRVAAAEGPLFVDSSALFEINPDISKRVAERDFGDGHAGRVRRGWILVARSGQTYGLIGSSMLAGARHEHKVVSDHIIRVAPAQAAGCGKRVQLKCRPGYVVVALTHPELGRPRVKALPYGSSIPSIEVNDLRQLQIPRLQLSLENEIADRVEEAARLRDNADEIETQLAESAEAEIRHFLGTGRPSDSNTPMRGRRIAVPGPSAPWRIRTVETA